MNNEKVFGLAWSAVSQSRLFLCSFVDQAYLDFVNGMQYLTSFFVDYKDAWLEQFLS